jgi:hypothetical protein
LIIAVWAELVGFVKVVGILAKGLFALFAGKRQFRLLLERVVFLLLMAFGTVKPFPAARCTNGDLSVENVFALGKKVLASGVAGEEGCLDEPHGNLAAGERTQRKRCSKT